MSGQRTTKPGDVRVLTAKRDQVTWSAFDIEVVIPPEHRARVMWSAVEGMDLSEFYATIQARVDGPGRDAFDPKVLLTLWLYATSEGVGSARHLARLCERDHAYMWICGGLRPNYHALSDFRVEHGDKLDTLLSELVASLMMAGVLKVRRVAQDGLRLRANAGAASFRRASTLRERCLSEAKAKVKALRAEVDRDPGASTAREQAAQKRAAEERVKAVERALKELPKVKGAHERTTRSRKRRAAAKGKVVDEKKSEPRVSTTDPEARVMKMADGGFRPAYNLQFATDVDSGVIVGVDVVSEGSDKAQLVPMLEQVKKRTGETPAEYLVDGGFTSTEAIDKAEALGVCVYAPVNKPRREGIDPHTRKPGDTDRTAAWRARMKTDEAKEIYKDRARVAEGVHADMRRWRGLQQLAVRGRQKARAVALLHALTCNLLRTMQKPNAEQRLAA